MVIVDEEAHSDVLRAGQRIPVELHWSAGPRFSSDALDAPFAFY